MKFWSSHEFTLKMFEISQIWMEILTQWVVLLDCVCAHRGERLFLLERLSNYNQRWICSTWKKEPFNRLGINGVTSHKFCDIQRSLHTKTCNGAPWSIFSTFRYLFHQYGINLTGLFFTYSLRILSSTDWHSNNFKICSVTSNPVNPARCRSLLAQQQNGLKPFSCYVKISDATKVI
jgi:hypothetical protein